MLCSIVLDCRAVSIMSVACCPVACQTRCRVHLLTNCAATPLCPPQAMTMCSAIARGKKVKFLVSSKCHPQTIAVCETRADGLGLKTVVQVRQRVILRGLTMCWRTIMSACERRSVQMLLQCCPCTLERAPFRGTCASHKKQPFVASSPVSNSPLRWVFSAAAGRVGL